MSTSITPTLLKALRLEHTRCKHRLQKAKTQDERDKARVAFNAAKAMQNAARAALRGGDDLGGSQGAHGDGSSSFSQPGPPSNSVLPTEDAPAATPAPPSTLAPPSLTPPPAPQSRKRKLSLSSFPSTSTQTPRLTRSRVVLEQADNQVIFPNVVVGLERGESVEIEIPKVGDWMMDWKALHASASRIKSQPTSRIKLHPTIQDLGRDLAESSREKTLIHVVRSYSSSNTDQDQERALATIGFNMDSITEWEAPQSTKRRLVCPFGQAFERDPAGQVKRLKCLGIKCLDEGGEATKDVERLRQSLACEPSLDTVKLWGTTGTIPPDSSSPLDRPPTPSSNGRQQQRRGRLFCELDNLWKGDPSSDWASVFVQNPSATSAELASMYQSTMRWAIVNGKGTYSHWHQDAGGALTFFVVKTGRKLWMVSEAEKGAVQAVVLEAGDAVVMTAGVWHAVYTLEDSICIGGVGWHPRHVVTSAEALAEESRKGSCETLPLWVPTFVHFGSNLLKASESESEMDGDMDDRMQSIMSILHTRPYTFPGKRVQAKSGTYTNGRLLEYGRQEVAGILKASLVEAARVVEGLRRV